MSEIRVVSWNAEGMFAEGTKTTRATPYDAIRVLQELNADIVVIPEFASNKRMRADTLQAIEALSYEYVTISYMDERAPDLHLAILSRLPIIHHKTYQLADTKRQILLVECQLPEGALLKIIGVHLDDRNEQIRMKQITSVVDSVNEKTDSAHMLVMGDFNAMSRDSFFARFARSLPVRLMTKGIMHHQIRSVIERVSEMAIGTTIEYLLSHTSLHNLDPGLQRTISAKQAGLEWMPSWRIGKIDWIFGDASLRVRSYKIMKDVGSDHRPVVADITVLCPDDNRTERFK